jgi:high-affinity Fe2+/Pb2+ permease
MFMTCVSVSYILFAPEGIGLITGALFGVTPSYALSVGLGCAVSLLLLLLFARRPKTTN